LLHPACRFQRVWWDCALQRAFADGTRRGGSLELHVKVGGVRRHVRKRGTRGMGTGGFQGLFFWVGRAGFDGA
jgi:hypothetical protein